MIDTERAQLVLIERRGRGVLVSVEEYRRVFVQSGRAHKWEAGTEGALRGDQ